MKTKKEMRKIKIGLDFGVCVAANCKYYNNCACDFRCPKDNKWTNQPALRMQDCPIPVKCPHRTAQIINGRKLAEPHERNCSKICKKLIEEAYT